MYEETDSIFAYMRTNEETGQRILVAANFGTAQERLALPAKIEKVLLSNADNSDMAGKEEIVLYSSDVVVILL